MRLLRVAAAVIVLAATGWGIYRLAWIPYRCEAKKVRLQNATDAAQKEVDDYRATLLARSNLQEIAHCREHLPHDLQFIRLAAANQRRIGLREDAIATLRQALQTDRRPELYWEIGLILIELGRIDEALRWLGAAVTFAPFLAGSPEIDEPMRARVHEGMRAREEGIRAGTWREPPLPL
jgi:tetratricopeptide (TPR) repeat protein